MRAFVTGGAGFIGSNLVDALIERADEVVVLDDLSTGSRKNLAAALEGGAVLTEGDVVDGSVVATAVRGFAPDVIFHLAAQVDVRRAVADPAIDAERNVIGTINVLEAARAAGGTPVVFASTGGAIYGEGDGRSLPLTEQADPLPMTAYGVSKLCGEHYLALYRRLYRQAGVALRFGNVYGPRQEPHGEAGVVAILAGQLLEAKPPTVFGDGRQTRDYIYVDDAVAAALAASAMLIERGADLEGPYNIGTGVETSILQLIEALADIHGQAQEALHAPSRTGEIGRISINPAAAERDFGWHPQTTIELGLAATYDVLSGRSGAVGGNSTSLNTPKTA